MKQKISFLKMQGIGNDFIVLNDLLVPEGAAPVLLPKQIRALCDRRFGIGADQIVWMRALHGAKADCFMEIWNQDGTQAEMCGNGIRAVGVLLFEMSQGKKNFFLIETLAGVKTVEVLEEGKAVRVNMGVPVLGEGFADGTGEVLVLPNREERVRFFEVNVGNPHAVLFVPEVADLKIEDMGPMIESHPRFPKRTNVEFVEVSQESPNMLHVRVWERGAGATLACGTGACAAVVAAIATGRCKDAAAVQLPGGRLKIEWAGPGKPLFMKGPAEKVFQGTIEIG